MNHIKVVIDIQEASIQAIYSNTPMDIIIVDRDCLEYDENPVQAAKQPDVVHPFLYELFDSDTEGGAEIREQLKKLKF